MSEPKLSFIIPFYNKPKSIQKCLKSLFAQHYKDFEVLVIMDGEDLEGEKLIRKFKHVKVFTIPHGGAPAARNFGLKEAKGEIVVFWDADCYIESGASEVWMQIFRKFPDVDFVYASYRFFPEGLGYINAEPFDPWLLQVNNYISGCFPIRKPKAPQWDESLKSLQDWDFWLTAVKNGCKGHYLRGYAFKTDFPDEESISGFGCKRENWLERLEAVKTKHQIPIRTTCVTSIEDKYTGINLAKMIDADYRDMPTYFPNRYNRIIQIGFPPKSADVAAVNFQNQSGPIKRILFWRPEDVHILRSQASVEAMEALALTINKIADFQFCEDHSTNARMKSSGFNTSILALPMKFDKDEVLPKMPEKFKVLFDVDAEYKPLFDSIKRSLPDVELQDFNDVGDADSLSVLVHFHQNRSIDSNVKKVLLNGRYVVSNIQAPFCGYIGSERNNSEDAKTDIVNQIRALQNVSEINQKAVDFYRSQCSPEKFIKSLELLEKQEVEIA